MSLQDKILALQEAADKLAAKKDSDSDSDLEAEGDSDDIEDGTEDETTSKKAKDTVKESTLVDLGTLFDGVELTEEFKLKAQTIFESAVAVRVAQEVELMENELAQRALDESVELKEGLVEKVDGYLDYMVEQWMKNNEIALERGIKAEIFESFVSKMHDVFLEHNINLPDEEFDLVESTLEKTEQLEAQLDEQVAQNIELNKVIKQYAKDALIVEHSTGMTDIDAEKFALLADEINFDDETSFAKKLDTIRENYVSKPVAKEVKELTEDVTQGANEPVEQLNETVIKVDPVMNQYLSAFAK
jgi:hypothetical protein